MATCAVCGGELDGAWVRFHRAPPYDEDEGHYVDGPRAPREPQGQEACVAGTSAPPAGGSPVAPPERAPRQRLASWIPEYFRWLRTLGPEERVGVPPGPVPKRPAWMMEDELRGEVKGLLELLGYDWSDLEQGWRPEAGHARVTLGVPDLYFRGHGRRGWIETKRWDRQHTPEQREWMLAELSHGGIYLLVYELEQLVRWHEARGAPSSCLPIPEVAPGPS